MTKLDRERRHWEELASDDPMWVILTEPGKKGAWDEREFFASGEQEIEEALGLLRDQFGVTPRMGTALDFGCGLGRLTQALGARFARVHGVDISETMVRNAERKNRHGARVTYHVNVSDGLPMLSDGSIDFIYSRITLQHIPRAAMKRYVAEFGRVLAPGGVAMFQVLTRARSLPVRLRHAVRDMAPRLYRQLRDFVSRRARFEMNVLSEAEARHAAERDGARVVAIFDANMSDPVFDCRWVLVTKPAR